MLRLILVILSLACLGSSANAFTHGLPAAAVRCNIISGVATGTGAGTCASTPATCNNTGDDRAAFDTFNTWARTVWQASFSGVIELYIPPGSVCRFASITSYADGIKKLRVIAYGATFNDAGGTGIFHFAGGGQYQDNAHSARVNTVATGASSVTLTNTGTACAPSSCAALFSAGSWALITGFDLQGFFGVPFGFPSNPFYFEYVQITSVIGNVVTFSTPLKNAYKATWPVYNNGSSGEIDNGGPATLYALKPSFDTEVEYRGLSVSSGVNRQYDASGRSVTFRDLTWAGSGAPSCLFPTSNYEFRLFNASLPNCQMEVDKLIDSLTLSNVTEQVITFQSTGVNSVNISNSNINLLLGSGKKTTISNTALGQFQPGPINFGRADEVICNSCVVGTFGNASGLNYPGGQLNKSNGDMGFNNTATMAAGVIQFPNGSLVSGIGTGTAGVVRLTLGSTAGFVTGKFATTVGVFCIAPISGACPVVGTQADGTFQYNVINGTQIDLVGTSAAAAVWGGGGSFGNRAPGWAVPGSNLFWTDENGWVGPLFRVTDVTQDATNTYITTTCTSAPCVGGTFPTPIGTATKNYIYVHPAPMWTCILCSGADKQMASFNSAPARAPLWSYQTYTFTGAIGTTAQQKFGLWGNPTQFNFNVTNAYNGVPALSFNLGAPWLVEVSNGTTANYSAAVNSKSVGNRQIALPGVTCPSGTCTGDSGLTLPDATQSWFVGFSNSGPSFSADASASCPGVGCPSVTITMQTDQGVVNPP